ncbi:deoxyhypusine synthase [Candidatus Woesearchaeota archaeon CG10_big_fil_rev_8_21_14_0_10_34_8]|nr:MAG: deoxyhypusine synthase [Candidatus Woesearchaeota archaeon CG10_big_fil_rev_8_21_14_0_10_34_8]
MRESPKSYQEQGVKHNIASTADVDNLPKVKGYDFEKPFNLNEFLKAYGTTGFQATHLARAIDIINEMKKENTTIFLGYTSNMISSGVREAIKFLTKHKHVQCIVTTAGGIEEDIIKTLKPFAIGVFNVSGRSLFDKGINRTGNLFIPNDRYLYFEKFINPFLERLYKEQKEKNIIHSSSDIIRELGKEINNEDSVLYWAYKNNISVYCPALMDGSFGDLVYFMKQRHPDFKIDITEDMKKIVNFTLQCEKTGAIILGAGIAKHFILNANIFKEGLDYTVYINTAQEFDGSDSGAQIEEAITWGKVKPSAKHVKIHADATIVFPLVVAATFGKKDE